MPRLISPRATMTRRSASSPAPGLTLAAIFFSSCRRWQPSEAIMSAARDTPFVVALAGKRSCAALVGVAA
jgi:hypothetical protein